MLRAAPQARVRRTEAIAEPGACRRVPVGTRLLPDPAQLRGDTPTIVCCSIDTPTAGRRLNDGMGAWVASELVKLMIRRGVAVAQSRVLVLGITFKENCPDIRNTRVVDVVQELAEYGCTVSIHDPWADPEEVREEYGLELLPALDSVPPFDGVILTVSHREFAEINPRELMADHGAIYDVKSFWPRELVDKRL